jgi:hypothetical protein
VYFYGFDWSRLARGSDPNVRIKALEGLAKLERDEREQRSPEEDLTEEEFARRFMSVCRPEGAPILWAELFLGCYRWHARSLAILSPIWPPITLNSGPTAGVF